MDSQLGCDNVAAQRCTTKLQPTYNLKIEIALNLINVCFKYQLNFFTLDFLKGYSWPPNFYFPVVTILRCLYQHVKMLVCVCGGGGGGGGQTQCEPQTQARLRSGGI